MNQPPRAFRPNNRLLIQATLLGVCLVLAATGRSGAQTAPTPEATPPPTQRERWSLDSDWSFAPGKAGDLARSGYLLKGRTGFTAYGDFKDKPAVRVRLPNDWAVDLPPVATAVGNQAFKPLGADFPNTSIGWYWRKLEVPKSYQGRRIRLQFDGIYRDAKIWVNGYYLGDHEPGYTSFGYDITELLNYGGQNGVVVRVDASQREGWWYEGAGIYRSAWLEITDPVSVAPDGVFVRTEFPGNVPGPLSRVLASVEVRNAATGTQTAQVQAVVLDPQGRQIASSSAAPRELRAQMTDTFDLALDVKDPALWSPAAPALYTLVTSVQSSDSQTTDETRTRFGFRTIAFDADKGFLLNGQPFLLKGVCLHADFPTVGTAMTRSLHAYRLDTLQGFGCNAIRMSHGPADPELMDVCDEKGFLVMAENRAFGPTAYGLEQFRSLIRRDRNHPAVILWSIGNEERDQDTAAGQQMAREVVSFVHMLDPTRPTTIANNRSESFEGVNAAVDVHGWNYGQLGAWVQYHQEHPTQPTVMTEQNSGRGTRGMYEIDPKWFPKDKKSSDLISSYNLAPDWRLISEHRWLSGWFVWTGFDYAGEVRNEDWPLLHSSFGVVDRCGFWKDVTYGYLAAWVDKPVLHLLPHWNWAGQEGKNIRVVATNNASEVELFLNGRSLGRRPGFLQSPVAGKTLTEWQVPYEPGILAAKGYDGDRVVSTDKVETTGEPAGFSLNVSRPSLPAHYGEFAMVKVAVVDAKGRVVPTAGTAVSFSITGPGTIRGVSSGDPTSHDPEQTVQGHAFNGWLMAVIEAKPEAGTISVTAQAPGLAPQQISLQTVSAPAIADWP